MSDHSFVFEVGKVGVRARGGEEGKEIERQTGRSGHNGNSGDKSGGRN